MDYSRRRNWIVLWVCLIAAALTAVGSYLMYRNAINHSSERLRDSVRFQARLIASLVDVERAEHKLSKEADPLDLVGEHLRRTFDQVSPLSPGVSYRIGRMRAGQVEIVAASGAKVVDSKAATAVAEGATRWQDRAMALALLGGEGMLYTRDARGAKVLAAYTAVSGAEYGLVAQLDLSVVRDEFIQSGALFVTIAIVLVLLASLTFIHFTEPLLIQLTNEKERYQFAIEAAEEGIWEWNLETGSAWRSPRLQQIYGYRSGELGCCINDWKALVHPEDWPEVASVLDRDALASKDGYQQEYRVRHSSGEWIWVYARGSVVSRDRNGRPVRVVGTLRDISRRKQAELALQCANRRLEERERYFRQLFEQAPLAYQSLDSEGKILQVNHAWLEMLGYSREQVLGRSIAEFIEPESRKLLPTRFAGFKERGEVQDLGFTLQRSNGQLVDVLVNGRISYDESGRVSNTHCILTNLSEQQRIHRQVAEERAFFQSVIDGVADPIMVIGVDYQVQLMNRAAAENSSKNGCEDSCATCYQASHHSDAPCSGADHECPLQLVLDSGQVERVVHTHYDAGGNPRIYELSASPLRDDQGEIIGIIEASRDITERVELEETLQRKERHLQHMAYHDALTDLPNRVLFLDRLEHALQLAERKGEQVAVLFIDLDRFKEINDAFGHSTGDLVLQLVSDRLWQTVREEDTLARLGGDEFILLLGDLKHGEDAARVARKINAAFSLPLSTDTQEFFLSASIGISIFPGDGSDAETLVKNADAAMYRAKSEGRNTYQYYSQEMTERAFERVLMESSLRSALEHDEFVLHYQPQIDTSDGRVIGAEALIRWQHPEMGLVSPGRFLPIAEESGLITALDGWVLEHVCRQRVLWNERGLDPGRISVNLSGRQLARKGLLQWIRSILLRTGCHPEWLELEITEGFVMNQPEQSIALFTELRRQGFELAIDDFGTGYSSLSYLKRLPIDKLKIDQSFVAELPLAASDAAIAKTVIDLGANLHLTVVAEGVETREQLEFLQQQGCHLVQGFLYARPLPAEEFARFLKEQNARSGAA